MTNEKILITSTIGNQYMEMETSIENVCVDTDLGVKYKNI